MGDGEARSRYHKVRREVANRVRAVTVALAQPRLRRLELAWLGFNAAEYAVTVALGVYAFARGGAAAVGIVTLARTLPGIVSAPLLSVVADRLQRRTVLGAGLTGRAVASLAIAVALFVDGPPLLVYVLAALDVTIATAFYPAAGALIPDLCRTPSELSSANAVFSVMENVGALIGPLFAAGAIALTGTTSVFVVAAALYLAGAVATFGLTTDRRTRPLRGTRLITELTSGLATLREHRQASIVIALWTFESIIVGAGEVFVVVIALELLGLGDPGVGLLSAVMGFGGLAGAAAMATFTRAQPYGRYLGLALALLALGLIGAATLSVAAAVIVAVLIVGVAQSQADVSAQTLLQRTVPEAALGRVLGAFEGLYWGALGVGAILASLASVALGAVEALLLFGVVAAVIMLAALKPLARIDEDAVVAESRIESLMNCHLFAVLPVPTVEYLAVKSEEVEVPAGTEIVREGDRGDRFYVIFEGEAHVTTHGRGVATLGPGDYFGEIALLLDVPRTASVHAVTNVVLLAVDAGTFVAAVTNHTTSADEAGSVAVARMAQTRRIGRGT